MEAAENMSCMRENGGDKYYSSSPNTLMFTSGMKAEKNRCEAKHVKYLAKQGGLRLRSNEPVAIEGESTV